VTRHRDSLTSAGPSIEWTHDDRQERVATPWTTCKSWLWRQRPGSHAYAWSDGHRSSPETAQSRASTVELLARGDWQPVELPTVRQRRQIHTVDHGEHALRVSRRVRFPPDQVLIPADVAHRRIP
jgi:hypothetical protein